MTNKPEWAELDKLLSELYKRIGFTAETVPVLVSWEHDLKQAVMTQLQLQKELLLQRIKKEIPLDDYQREQLELLRKME